MSKYISKDESRDIYDRKNQVVEIINKLNNLGLNCSTVPELLEVYDIFKNYIKDGFTIKKKIKCMSINKYLHVDLYNSKRATCSITLKKID